jgi:hypothetical protein
METSQAFVLKAAVRDAADAQLIDAANALVLRATLRIDTPTLHRGVHTDDVYVYGCLSGAFTPAAMRALLSVAKAFFSCALQPPWCDPLEIVSSVAGPSAGMVASHHYVVETDADDGWEAELAQWYDREHLPGLAAVKGCVHARRYVNQGRGPRSLACYDLTHPEVLDTPEWLAVRATGWSSRVRPHFRNTRRTMFRSLPLHLWSANIGVAHGTSNS